MTAPVVVVATSPVVPAEPPAPAPPAVAPESAATTDALKAGIEVGAGLGEAIAARDAAIAERNAATSEAAGMRSELETLRARVQSFETAETARLEAERLAAEAIAAETTEIVDVPAETVKDGGQPAPVKTRNWLRAIIFG